MVSGIRINAKLSHNFLGTPFQDKEFENYVAIDTTGLAVIKGRENVFVVINEGPLDVSGRIVGFGKNQP